MERWYDKFDKLDVSDSDEECQDEDPEAQEKFEDGVMIAVQEVLGDIGKQFTVIGGVAIGGDSSGDEKLSAILAKSGLGPSRRPDFLCHQMSVFNSVLWIRWISDVGPPYNDALFLCLPDMAAPTAVHVTEQTKELFMMDSLTKICQLAHLRGNNTLLLLAFRLLAPGLAKTSLTLYSFLKARTNSAKGDKDPSEAMLVAYDAGLKLLEEELSPSHVLVMNVTEALGNLCDSVGSNLDQHLDKVAAAQSSFQEAIRYYQKWLQREQTALSPGEGPLAGDAAERTVKLRLAGVLKRLHNKEEIRHAANIYRELGEEALADETANDAAAWNS
ncbi:hypothetical protein CYMTET_30435 [Cymbomonas tetramitiformis]|uniref:Uncharacterized protein n=1 Tax=Cymbomonas tetramitiformis TaxID=36881 RepID=A0AAE0FIU2_9CHLO|nr:hypothetical protein CYMTET_30435 [Cymbomonas tetramitiformis]